MIPPSRSARSKRLADLYNLRAQINSEIAHLEAEVKAEVRIIRAQLQAEDRPQSQPKRRRFAECGTDGGYHHHRRVKKEPACHACLDAHSAAERDRVLRKAAAAS